MIGQRIKLMRTSLPADVNLCAVSKYHPAEAIQEAYDAGQRIFGESHVQELQQKHSVLPPDIEWHFIGHLQTNKVKYIASYISMIHSVDSPRLLNAINKHALLNNRKIPCLLQLHVAQEETKFGFAPDECLEYLRSKEYATLAGIKIAGIMCMATNTDDEARVRVDFHTANQFFQQCIAEFPDLSPDMTIRSWGMSEDYKIAIEEGSNMVRIGSRIFGPRM
ncbi:MAG: YggS family pyridoxal phosphate-dependent enzyme [Paraprevotella sp.]|nr:YggS family pyridoxal phosphate-dependent enzyme [Paraprevotella sp.]